MSRQLTVVQPLPPGDHGQAFRGSPQDWLPDPRRAGPGRWRIGLQAGGIERAVLCEVGDPWTTREGVRRRIAWTPLAEDADVLPIERWLPALEGELHLVGALATPSLALVGQVDVPLGRFGEAVDALMLGRLAQRGAAMFLSEVAERLTDQPTEHQPASSGTHHRS